MPIIVKLAIAMIAATGNEKSQISHVNKSLYSLDIQCVSVDSTSFVIYPELEATEVRFSALNRCFCSFYFRIDNETGGNHRNTLYI